MHSKGLRDLQSIPRRAQVKKGGILLQLIGGESQSDGDFERLEFKGEAREYFSIWIVNLILSILTLGIYSAWAKVRRIKYFHSNTAILGDGLRYHATGWMILKGRLLAFAIIALYIGLFWIEPGLEVLLIILLTFLYPWMLCRSLRFKARMTSWRNVRFQWWGTYGEAFSVLFLWPIGSVISLGLLLPAATRARHRFLLSNLYLGGLPFNYEQQLGPYFKSLGLALLTGVPLGALAVFGYWAVLQLIPYLELGDVTRSWPSFEEDIGLLIYAIAFGQLIIFYRTLSLGDAFSGLSFSNAARFQGRISWLPLTWIYLTNLIAVLASGLLLMPWAKIRLSRFLTQSIWVKPLGGLDKLIDRGREQTSAMGQEFSDFEGIDIGV